MKNMRDIINILESYVSSPITKPMSRKEFSDLVYKLVLSNLENHNLSSDIQFQFEHTDEFFPLYSADHFQPHRDIDSILEIIYQGVEESQNLITSYYRDANNFPPGMEPVQVIFNNNFEKILNQWARSW